MGLRDVSADLRRVESALDQLETAAARGRPIVAYDLPRKEGQPIAERVSFVLACIAEETRTT